MNIDEYEDHIVAFIDLLGFKESIKDTEEEKLKNILDILREFSALRNEQLKFITLSENAYSIKPAISVFSDHIVISCALSKIYPLLPEFTRQHLGLEIIKLLIAQIALITLDKGFLIRGGITVDKLYHREGVIFGQALIEAYNLESKTAVYPRIILSDKLSNQIKKFAINWKSEFYILSSSQN